MQQMDLLGYLCFVINSAGKSNITYYDRYGNKLDTIPTECKGLWDLLNED